MEERILGVFPIDVAAFFCDYYDMYFTNKRIVANFTGRGIWARATSKIIIPIGGWIDWFIIRPLLKREKKGPFSDAEQILKADKDNFAWDYQTDIRSIEFKKHVGAKGPMGGGAPPGMVITLARGEKKKCFCRKKDLNAIKSLLQEVAGEKLTL